MGRCCGKHRSRVCAAASVSSGVPQRGPDRPSTTIDATSSVHSEQQQQSCCCRNDAQSYHHAAASFPRTEKWRSDSSSASAHLAPPYTVCFFFFVRSGVRLANDGERSFSISCPIVPSCPFLCQFFIFAVAARAFVGIGACDPPWQTRGHLENSSKFTSLCR